MTINGIAIDVARGFDVMRGRRLLKHFDTYEEAQAYINGRWGYYLRYWGIKEGT